MLFRRRKPADTWEKTRTFFWPRRSFLRSFQYFSKRVLRLTASPHAVAAGVAAGVFASFTPLLGLHFIIAGVLAYILAGNLLASAFGTAIGNPLTFPFIWGATFQTGRFILTGSTDGEAAPMHLGESFWHLDWHLLWEPLIKPMLVGAIPIGLAFAVAFYLFTRFATVAFRQQRARRLAAKARRRADRASIPGGAAPQS